MATNESRDAVAVNATAVSLRARVTMLSGLALAIAGCRGKHRRTAVQNEEQPDNGAASGTSAEGGPRIASAFKMGDAAASAQLPRGFYGLESGSWRWTAGTFSVLLRPPLAAAQHGAVLTFAFSIPDVVIEKLKSFTLSAKIGGSALKSQTYSKPGSYTYTADVPAGLLDKEAIIVDFALDRHLPAGSVDQRELGVVATAAGLESK